MDEEHTDVLVPKRVLLSFRPRLLHSNNMNVVGGKYQPLWKYLVQGGWFEVRNGADKLARADRLVETNVAMGCDVGRRCANRMQETTAYHERWKNGLCYS